ncbi:MAG: GAF domain-containing protein [Verrucomicrobiota bacterium]
MSGFDDLTARLPLQRGFLGEVALRGEQTYLRDLEDGAEAVGLEWLNRERIRVAGVTPIMFQSEVLGLMIGFTREDLPEEARPWGRIFADHVGAAIANARAL